MAKMTEERDALLLKKKASEELVASLRDELASAKDKPNKVKGMKTRAYLVARL